MWIINTLKAEYKFLKLIFQIVNTKWFFSLELIEEFWLPNLKTNKSESYVLAVGNDLAKKLTN